MTGEAIDEYNEVLKLTPDDLAALYNRGVLHLENGNLHDASADMKKIIERNPKLAAARYKLGDIYKKQGQIDDAITAYKQALEISPEMKEALRSLEDAYWIKERQTKKQMDEGGKIQ